MSENVNRHETATSEPASNQEGGSCSGASFCSPTLQVRYELANRVIRECDKLFQDGDDRFSVDAFGMLKDYAERECNVCVLFRTGGHDAQHFVAVIKYPVLEDKWGHFGLKPVLLIGRHPGKSEETVVDSAGDSDEQPVLIEVVHFTEERETILPAAVRLQRLDNIDGCGSNPGYFAVKALGVLHLKDWEACVASRNLSICLNELPRQVVECGPEVVDRIPDHQRERLWQLGPKADAEDFFTTVRIGFGFKTIRVSFAKLPRHDFDIIDVCFGPCDLSAGSVKSCDGGSHELVGERPYSRGRGPVLPIRNTGTTAAPVQYIVRQLLAVEDDVTQEFFTHDEVALMRFMEMCQETCDPDNYGKFMELANYLISIRPGLRDGAFERVEAYMKGERLARKRGRLE